MFSFVLCATWLPGRPAWLSGRPRAVVLIAYFETPAGHKTTSSRNLQFFLDYTLKAGLLGVEYDVIIMEAQHDRGGKLYWRYFTKLNTQFRWLFAKNEGFDFCLWKKAMAAVHFLDYDFFVFMNGSVRGPKI